MKLIAYNLGEQWPQIRPAPSTRPWLDKLPQAFAYRCLPLNIGCSHGWEVLCPVGFEASWNGKDSNDGIWIRQDREHPWKPQAHFSNGILTFHTHHLFRTETGFSMYVTGPTNAPKHGIAPLTGVVETDWAPYTFTMNWKFTAPGMVRFEEGEPFCLFFPVARGLLDDVTPEISTLEADPETKRNYEAWKQSRDQFNKDLHELKADAVQEKWQKSYYRGLLPSGAEGSETHQIKMQLKPFAQAGKVPAWPAAAEAPAAPEPPPPKVTLAPAAGPGSVTAAPPQGAEAAAIVGTIQSMVHELVAGADPAAQTARLVAGGLSEPHARNLVESAKDNPLVRAARSTAHKLRKREWLLDTIEGHRRLLPDGGAIERRGDLGPDEFFAHYYSAHRPVVLLGKIASWPALAKWTPAYLRGVIGSRIIEFQGERKTAADFEIYKDRHKREMPFDQFIDMIQRPGAGNDAYITAYNSSKSQRNAEALGLLHPDLGFLDEFLVRNVQYESGQMWIGPAGTLTSMHHDLTNNFIVQLVGRKRVTLVPAADVSRIYNSFMVYSDIPDLEAPGIDDAKYPLLRDLKRYDVLLNPGDILFMPIGWWHQVKSLDFSVTITYTNFRWSNDWHRTFPTD